MATKPNLHQAPSQEEHAEYSDMRAAPRFTLMLRQARLLSPAGQFLCVVRDISESGIRVKVFHSMPDNPEMEIEVAEGSSAGVIRVWERGDEAGFRFAGPLDLEAFLADDPRFPRRQFRLDLEFPITVCVGATEIEARTSNVSQQGACIICPQQLARHSLVRIRSAKLPPVHAKVMWRDGDMHGLVFEDTFSYRDFAVALGHLQGLA